MKWHWVQAKDLRAGDTVMKSNGTILKIESIKSDKRTETVYMQSLLVAADIINVKSHERRDPERDKRAMECGFRNCLNFKGTSK